MNEDPVDDMNHEDNSMTTKLGVIIGIVLVTMVLAGSLMGVWVIWQIIRLFFIN